MSPPTEDQKLRDLSPKWLSELAGFYSGIQVKFAKLIQNYNDSVSTKIGWPKVGKPTLWKVNGDELIYVSELRSALEAVALLFVWLSASREYRSELHKKNSALDVKLTAWTAGFPLHNIEVVFSDDDFSTDKYLQSLADQLAPEEFNYHLLERWYSNEKDRGDGLRRDFIGPSIDIGFRLAAKASPRKFVISLELVHLWAKVGPLPKEIQLQLFFDGLQDLKGVFGNRPYPIFWLDVLYDHAVTNALNAISGAGPVELSKTLEFCEAFIEDNVKYVFRPFIINDTDARFAIMPEHYRARLERIEKEWKSMKETFEIFKMSMEGEEFKAESKDSEPNSSLAGFKVLKNDVDNASKE